MGSQTPANVILITGANSGVGYYAAKAFYEAEREYHVLAAARSEKKAQDAVDELKKECPNATNKLEAITIDVTSDDSIQTTFEQVKNGVGRLDTLINNAGATFDIEFVAAKISLRDCFNKAYDTNVTGAHVTTWTFMPLLLKSSDPRLLFVAGLSQITVVNEGPYFPTPDLPAGWPKEVEFETIGYRCSKTALNMLTLDWSHKLKADKVKVWGVSPGFLATGLGNIKDRVAAMGGGHPSEGAKVYKDVVEGKRDHQVGKVIMKDGLVRL